MSALANVAISAEQSRVSLRVAGRRLFEQWHDQHARAFDHEIFDGLDTTTGHLISAIQHWDNVVDGIFAGLRDLGGVI
jgi:hypothetical protein